MADNSGTASSSTGDHGYAAALAALQEPGPEAGAAAPAAVPPVPQETLPQPRVPPPGLAQVSQIGQARRDRVMGLDGELRRKGRPASPRKVDPLALWQTLPPTTPVTQVVNVKVPETPPPATLSPKIFDIASPLGDMTRMNVGPKDERWHNLVDAMKKTMEDMNAQIADLQKKLSDKDRNFEDRKTTSEKAPESRKTGCPLPANRASSRSACALISGAARPMGCPASWSPRISPAWFEPLAKSSTPSQGCAPLVPRG